MTDLKIVIEKVEKEREELKQKIEKLEKMISSETFATFDTDTRVQLLTQLHHMSGYNQALICRVAHMREMIAKKEV